MKIGDTVGVNFSLNLQKIRMESRDGARICRTLFPALKKAKIFNYDVDVIDALRIEGFKHVSIAVPNSEVGKLASDPTFAESLASDVIQRQVKHGLELCLGIGNEPLAPYNEEHVHPSTLVKAYRNMRLSLQKFDMSFVKIFVPFYYGIMGISWPPNMGEFKSSLTPVLRPLLALFFEDRSTFVINIYPFFTQRSAPGNIDLSYALGKTGITHDGRTYRSLLHAQVAAVRAALLRMDRRYTESGLPIVIGETGWPTHGDSKSPTATIENAAIFTNNAVSNGLPLYLFEAFDENLKSQSGANGAAGDATEDNFGICTEEGRKKFETPELTS